MIPQARIGDIVAAIVDAMGDDDDGEGWGEMCAIRASLAGLEELS